MDRLNSEICLIITASPLSDSFQLQHRRLHHHHQRSRLLSATSSSSPSSPQQPTSSYPRPRPGPNFSTKQHSSPTPSSPGPPSPPPLSSSPSPPKLPIPTLLISSPARTAGDTPSGAWSSSSQKSRFQDTTHLYRPLSTIMAPRKRTVLCVSTSVM